MTRGIARSPMLAGSKFCSCYLEILIHFGKEPAFSSCAMPFPSQTTRFPGQKAARAASHLRNGSPHSRSEGYLLGLQFIRQYVWPHDTEHRNGAKQPTFKHSHGEGEPCRRLRPPPPQGHLHPAGGRVPPGPALSGSWSPLKVQCGEGPSPASATAQEEPPGAQLGPLSCQHSTR